MSYINKISFKGSSDYPSYISRPEGRNIKESRKNGFLREIEDINFINSYPDATGARIIYNGEIDKTKFDLKKDNKIAASMVTQGDNIDHYKKLLHIAGFGEEDIEIGVSTPHSIAPIDGLDALGSKERVRVQRALIDLEMKNRKCPIKPSEYDTIRVSETGNEILLESDTKKAFLDLHINKKIMTEANQDGNLEVVYSDEDGIEHYFNH